MSAFLAFAMSLTGGCGTLHPAVRNIPEEEVASVRAGKYSIVFFRLAPRLDNIPVMPASETLGPDRPFIFQRASIDRRETPTGFQSYSSSADAAAGNWVYFPLSPGAHWIGVLTPPYAGAWDNAYLSKNGFYLEVPGGVPLLYAGTLSASCTSRWGILGRLIDRCDEVRVEDESEAAGVMANRDFGKLGQMETVLLRPMKGGPVAEGSKPLFPMGVAVKGSLSVSTPEWRERGVDRAMGLGSNTGELIVGVSLGLGPGGTFIYLMYLPFGTAAGLIGGSYSAWKWGPCMDNIAENVVDWSPPDALLAEFMEALSRRGIDNVVMVDDAISVFKENGETRIRSLFEVEVQEVTLRECGERWTFCAELKVRGRLHDLARKRTLYDGILVYSNSAVISTFSPDRIPYERFADAVASCRPIEEYCAPGGARIFVGDLGDASRMLVDQMLEEMRLSPHLQ